MPFLRNAWYVAAWSRELTDRAALRAALDGAVRDDGVTIVEALVPSESACVGLGYLDAVVSFVRQPCARSKRLNATEAGCPNGQAGEVGGPSVGGIARRFTHD
jgi:hypothetical protein